MFAVTNNWADRILEFSNLIIFAWRRRAAQAALLMKRGPEKVDYLSEIMAVGYQKVILKSLGNGMYVDISHGFRRGRA
jgi:hypothetical protein